MLQIVGLSSEDVLPEKRVSVFKRAHISAGIVLIWRRPPFSNNLPRCHYFHIHRYKLTKQTAWLESFRAPLLPRWLLSCWH